MSDWVMRVTVPLMVTTMGALFMSVVLLIQVSSLSERVEALASEIRTEFVKVNESMRGK